VIHYLSFVGSVGAIYALLAIALVFIWGQAGIVNLGLAGFFAVGAYTAALLSVKMGLPFIVGVATGAVTSAMTGVALTWITRRMDADYLAIVALGFAEALRLVLQNEAWLTGGTDGISGVPMPLRISSGSLAAEVYCGLVFAFLFLCGLLVRRLIRSPFGRALRATRDDAAVASMAGKNALAFRLKATSPATSYPTSSVRLSRSTFFLQRQSVGTRGYAARLSALPSLRFCWREVAISPRTQPC
jgi:branched-chain amino acid transport system permease protein